MRGWRVSGAATKWTPSLTLPFRSGCTANPVWAAKPFGAKHILLVVTVFNLLSAMNYWMNTGVGEWAAGACEFQSVVMLLFEATSSPPSESPSSAEDAG